MNSLTAAELKRRGMAAIEEGLLNGPVHLVKRNKLAAVVISTEEYARLSLGNDAKPTGMTAVEWLMRQPATGGKRKQHLDKLLRTERDGWT